MIALPILLIGIGITILILGAKWLVLGAGSVARKLGVSPLIIGLTIVAFGTSAPELIVNLLSALRGSTDLALGNIIGSNIANVLLILGATGCIVPLTVQRSTTWKEIPFALLASVALLIMGLDITLAQTTHNSISHGDGFILIAFFIIFMYYTVGLIKTSGDALASDIAVLPSARSVVLIVLGCVGLFFGGTLLVDNAVVIARVFGLSEALIGLTIVAVGTSLPELATSIVAALQKQDDIAVGNVVGSNIFNVFWILGLTSIIKPLPLTPEIFADIGISIIATMLLFFAMFVGKRHKLERWQAVCFLIMYVGYLGYAMQRG